MILSLENKKIGQLSKGYKQRVGLAAALIHEPEVLILDEPTSGLDPNQIIEIRNVIKALAKDKTVLFSTHILQEVEALCDRVVVINKGKIVADDRLTNLLQSAANYLLVEFADNVVKQDLMQIEGVEQVRQLENFRFQITAAQGKDIRPIIVTWAVQKNLSLRNK